MTQFEKEPKRLKRWTPSTNTRSAQLRHDLRVTHERGYSVDLEEHIIGVRCLGAPLIDSANRTQGAIAIQAPSTRMPEERIHELASRLIAAAKEIGSLLFPGHRLSAGFEAS